MADYRIDPVDPDRVSEADLASWHRCQVAVRTADFPDDPPPPYTSLVSLVRHGDNGPDREADRWLWFAYDATGEVIGDARLTAARHENPHLAEVGVYVRPDHRRAGLGRSLFDTAHRVARETGRTTMYGWAVDRDGPAGFATAMGMGRGATETRYQLRLAGIPETDLARLGGIGAIRVGFTLCRWTDRCPDDLVDAYALAWSAVNDIPRGSVRVHDRTWTAARIRRMERTRAARGSREFTIAVRDDTTGAVAGFTEVSVTPGGHRADQGYTAVPAEYRGRRFGLWLKAAMIEWLRTERPDVTEYQTWISDANEPMNAVNERLGFRPVERYQAWARAV